MFYLSAVFSVLALVFSFICVLAARQRIAVSASLSAQRALHGESASLCIHIAGRSILPISPIGITVCIGDEMQQYEVNASGDTQITIALHGQHVGIIDAHVCNYTLSDIFGLFRINRVLNDSHALLVLPRAFEVQPLHFMPGDDGRSLQNRTTEDLSSPEDTRLYRSGDALKRIHWKLSTRRRELIVRKFETPAPPDTLILLDCTLPGDDDATLQVRASLRDALCETALSVASMQSRSDSPVRVPLYGENANEFLSDRTGSVEILQEMLALQPFIGGIEFSRVLHMELRRMRRTGATVIITSRLNAGIVEGVKHIRRMGPAARVYLVTYTPNAPEDLPYVAQLQQCMVEVCYVTPA